MQILDKTKKLFNVEKGNIKRTLLKTILAVPFWITVAALFLIVFGISRALFLTSSRPDQYVAENWQSNSETSFRHMSVYAGGVRTSGDTSPMTCMEGGRSIRLADIALIRASLQSASSAGTSASVKNVPASDGKLRGWEDCYSSTVKGTLEAVDIRDGKEEVIAGKADAQIVAVGGNYKAFHPFRYMAGGFLPETPVDTYQIVINDVLAWKFYHSYDVVGNRININGQSFTIIGVVEEKSTKTAELAGEQDNRAFIYFGALGTVFGSKASAENTDAGAGALPAAPAEAPSDYAIQCYEALLPELVKGVAVSDFKSALPSYSITNPQVYVADNTGRFGIVRVYDTFFPVGETAKTRAGYEFPYWETAAQMTEDRLFYDYTIIGVGIILLLTGVAMIALKLRARKTVVPEELEASDVDEAGEEAQLLLEA